MATKGFCRVQQKAGGDHKDIANWVNRHQWGHGTETGLGIPTLNPKRNRHSPLVMSSSCAGC
jgi:hypothetical protein